MLENTRAGILGVCPRVPQSTHAREYTTLMGGVPPAEGPPMKRAPMCPPVTSGTSAEQTWCHDLETNQVGYPTQGVSDIRHKPRRGSTQCTLRRRSTTAQVKTELTATKASEATAP